MLDSTADFGPLTTLVTLIILLASISSLTKSYYWWAVLPVLSPTIWLFSYHLHMDLHKIIWVFALTSTLGIAIVITIQSILAYLIAFLLFGSDAKEYLSEAGKSEKEIKDDEHRKKRKEMSRRWQYWVFMLIFAFLLAGLVEEGLKYYIIDGVRSYGWIDREDEYIAIAIATALGFSTTENLGFIYAAVKTKEKPSIFVLTVLERVALGMPGHSMTAALLGLNMLARDLRHKDYTPWQILALPVFFHGCFDFMLFAISAYNGNIGWIHPRQGFTLYLAFLLAIGFIATLAIVLGRGLQQYGIV